jgi:hypothetical protein
MKWFLLLLISSSSLASVNFWNPNDKEMWTLFRKAERSQEFQLQKMAPHPEETVSWKGMEMSKLDCFHEVRGEDHVSFKIHDFGIRLTSECY